MFSLCLIYRRAVQTFCFSEDAPPRRLAADLPDGGELLIQEGKIIPRNLAAERVGGTAFDLPLSVSRDCTCMLKGRNDTALLLLRSVEPGQLIPACFALPVTASVGRGTTNSIVYQDRFVSTFHGRFFLNASGDLCYRDESTNGTAYNGRIVNHACITLKNGDQLLFPPLLRVMVYNDMLLINRPRGLLSCLLEPLEHTGENPRQYLLFFASAGMLFRIGLDSLPDRLAAFCADAARFLPPEYAPWLLSRPMLLEAHTRRPLTTDADWTDALQRGTHMFIVP